MADTGLIGQLDLRHASGQAKSLQPLPEMSIRGQAIRAKGKPVVPPGVAQADLPPALAAP
jgi:hypothetical protein